MLIGYARVSTQVQILDLQLDALEKIGCKEIYTDKVSNSKVERKGLDQALSYIWERDTFVVWRLDRLGRSLKRLIETITQPKITRQLFVEALKRSGIRKMWLS